METHFSNQLDALKSLFPFSLLNDEDLNRINHFFELKQFPAGSTIFSDGYPASQVYFILSGKVKIQFHHRNSEKNLGVLSTGDHFGIEALSGNQIYQTKALCMSAVTVLSIRGSKARAIADAYPDLHASFSLFKRTQKLTCSETLSWRAENEGIVLFSRRHPIFLFLRVFLIGVAFLGVFSFLLFAAMASVNFFVPLLILSLFEFFLGAIICAWAGMEWGNDFFILTRERVCVQKKLIGFYESRHESPVNAILSVGVDTSLIGRMIGYGTVTVRTYTGDLQFKRLPYPYVIYELLEIRRQAAAMEATQAEKQDIREAFAGKAEGDTHRKTLRSRNNAYTYSEQTGQSGSFSNFLAGIFNLRTEDEDSVTYRTHWWILLKKTLIPGLLLFGIVLVVIIRLLGLLSVIPEMAVYSGALILSIVGWGWWIYQFQDWQNDVYIITDEQLIDVYKKPLGNDDHRSAPVKNIQTVEFERKGLVSLILNFGTVKIKIGNEEFTFDNVYQPSVVQAEIYARYRTTLENVKKNEQQKFVEWIKTYEEIQKENQQAEGDERG